MTSTLETIALASQFLSFLGFLGTSIVLFRYLDPWKEYLVLADLTIQMRSMWDRCEYQDLLPKKESSRPLLQCLECSERELLELIYLIKPLSFRTCLRAWMSTIHLKMLVRDARNLHVALLIIFEYNRRMQDARRSGTQVDRWMEEKIESIGTEFIRKSTARDTGSCSQGGLPLRRTDTDATLVLSQTRSRPGRSRSLREICFGLIGLVKKQRAVAQQGSTAPWRPGLPFSVNDLA